MYQEALTEEGVKIFQKLEQFGGFYLAGGTALALQIGHRISVDFDLFSDDDIPKELLERVEKTFSESTISPLVNNPEELSVLIGGLKLTFLKYPFPVIREMTDLDGLKALGILELSATKAYTIGRRGSFKDYVDLYFVLSDNQANLEQIIELSEQKYGNEFNSRLFLEQLIYLEDIEEVEIIFLKELVKKAQLKEFFIKETREIKL